MEQTGEPILFDNVILNGNTTSATLTNAGYLAWTCNGGPRRCMEVKKDVIGISNDGNKIEVRVVVERGGGIGWGGNKRDMVRKRIVLEFEDEDLARVWFGKLKGFIDSQGRPKRLLILVNPYGGSKVASKIFTKDVKPLLEDANIEYTLQVPEAVELLKGIQRVMRCNVMTSETTHELHAKEIALSLDLWKYDGIVCVSGDGILVEVVNGLLERRDWLDAIKMPLGVVPAGTGNGMARSLLDAVGLPCTAFHATLAIIPGNTRSLDVTTVSQGETKFFSVLMLAWGLIADIDIESEKYRWMGTARFNVYAVQRVLRLRKYNGSICFVPAPGFEDYGKPRTEKEGRISRDKKVQECGYSGPDIEFESLNWRKIDGPFVSVWLHNVPWGSESTKAAPDAKFSDGYLDLILIRDCPKLGLLALMDELDEGNHVNSPHVSYLKVKALVLEPSSRTDDLSKGGIIDVDGEVLARGKGAYKAEKKSLMSYHKLQLTVDQGLATIFAPI